MDLKETVWGCSGRLLWTT